MVGWKKILASLEYSDVKREKVMLKDSGKKRGRAQEIQMQDLWD